MNSQTQLPPEELNTLIQLYKAARYSELESQSQAVAIQYPNAGIIWKLLGASQNMQGRNATLAFQNAAQLLPNDPEPYNNLGNIYAAREQLENAEESYNNALKIKPSFAEAHYNLGNLLIELGRIDEAIASYLSALQYQPLNAIIHSNLGTALQDLGRHEEAIICYRKAIKLSPDLPETYNNLGISLLAQHKHDEAVENYLKALSLNPNYVEAYGNMGNALQAQGKLTESLACYQQQLRLSPENSVAQHLLASLTGDNTERAPAQYVEKIFDGYADKFDSHLVQALEYDIPEKLSTLITQHITPPTKKWRILDLGCGTGLVGLAFSSLSQRLVGVDLSPKMLKKAQERNLYDRLECLDLSTMMRAESASSYEVIIAADVFVYLGKLDEIVVEIKRLLSSGGMFAFSVEAIYPPSSDIENQPNHQEYQLGITGRYAHSCSYITKLASANGFLIQAMEATQIRIEGGKPINGYLVLCRG